jgi:signal transduction histidine kinase
MDWFEVGEAIPGYSRSKGIPTVLLSPAETLEKMIEGGDASGCVDYVKKPVDPEALLLKVKTFNRLSEQRQQLTVMERAFRDLTKANQRLEESNTELQQFAFIASHDLQEPLRKIQTFSGLALDKSEDTDQKIKPYLGKILESATRLRNMVSDLLQYSQLYSNDEFSFIDLNAMLLEIMQDLELQIALKHCTFEISKMPHIECIPFQMRQVFQNLLSNSIKFAKGNDSCMISVEGELVKDKSFDASPVIDGEFCRIVVTDNGIGFSNEFRNSIFEIFQRLKTRHNSNGTGIGLAIVKKVVERHDGIIDAWGKENEGAKFTIVVPVKH